MITSKHNEIIILGSGTSTGVPIVGCSCNVCNSTETHDQRTRTSIVIHSAEGQHILVDTSPDLRSQLLREKLTQIDNCIITHEHADHCHGIDDLRPINFFYKDNIDIYTSERCAELFKSKFDYIFDINRPMIGGGIPRLSLQGIHTGTKRTISGLTFDFFLLPHGHHDTMLFSQGKFAYLVDINCITPEVLNHLREKNLELLIIDCVRNKPHRTHLNLDKALKYIKEIAAKKVRLIHLGHDWTHQELTEISMKHSTKEIEIRPAFDGERLQYSS